MRDTRQFIFALVVALSGLVGTFLLIPATAQPTLSSNGTDTPVLEVESPVIVARSQ